MKEDWGRQELEIKKIFKVIKKLILLFLILNVLTVGYEKIQCNRMLNAIRNNDINKLESILEFADPDSVPGVGVIDVFFENRRSRTPLGAACEKGDLKMVRLLLEEGADVNYVPMNAYGSPLRFAVASDSAENLEIVRLLLSKGADVNYSEYSTWQPAINLLECHNLPPNGMEILKALMEAGARTEDDLILQRACYWKHEEAIRYLAEEWGYDLTDPYYLCAYCRGVKKYSYETFKYFLEKGANPYKKYYNEYQGEKNAIDYLREDSPEWAEKLIKLAAEYGFEK